MPNAGHVVPVTHWYIYQDIIKEDYNKPLQHCLKNSIHCRLENGRGISQAKWHNEELEMTIMRTERSLVNVALMHSYLVVA